MRQSRTMTRRTVKSRHSLKRAVYLHLIRRGIFPDTLQLIQSGGAVVTVDGKSYQYWEIKEYGYLPVIQGGRKKGRRPCFIVLLNGDGSCVLQGLESGADCSMSPDATTRDTVLAAVEIARKKSLTRFQIMDDTAKPIATGKKFNLSNVYFLTTGKTWFESILPGLRVIDESYIDSLERWRDIVKTNAWDAVYRCLRERKPDVVIPIGTDDIDTNAPGSAMIVLSRIKDAKTDFFVKYEGTLIECSGISSLVGFTWELTL